MTFRDRLRAELDAQRINKKELAHELGISYSTLLSYIDARAVMPAADMAVRIAARLGVTVEYLVDGKAGQGGCSAQSQALLNEKNLSQHSFLLFTYKLLLFQQILLYTQPFPVGARDAGLITS